MPTFVVFLRAVNVAGRSVPMARLRESLLAAGMVDAETYIQSGNLRLTTALRDRSAVARVVAGVVEDEFAVPTTAIVRTPAELAQIVARGRELADPLPPGSRRYVALLARDPGPDAVAALDGWDVPGERARVEGREVYLWFTGPFHAARLNNARIERLGVVATTRDWKVVTALGLRWSPG